LTSAKSRRIVTAPITSVENAMRIPVPGAMLLVALLVSSPLFSAPLHAADSPVGTWTTIDDETGQPKSIIEISEQDGELTGKVVEVLQSDQGPNPVCRECEGERHDQPVVGMTILWGLRKDGDEWSGGQILDPHNGKTYKCKMHLVEGGSQLEVRGFIGFSLLGRTQTWLRRAP
jgi:uncharacterized protein (DUF2147 family)